MADQDDLAEVEIYKLFRKWRSTQKRPRVTDAWRAGYESGLKASLTEGVKQLPAGCGYQGYEFGAETYPDSICFGGKLYDADDGEHSESGFLYADPVEDIPCPMCREKDAIRYWTSRNQLSGMSKTRALKNARSLVADIRKNRGAE